MALSNASVSQLSDRQLMEGLREVARKNGEVTAELLAHLGEVEARRLCDREAEGSLFSYCVKVLNFSEGEAYKRIGAARTARAYPVVLEMVACGDLHLTAVRLLGPHLTVENHRALLQAAVRKSKREVEMLIAEWFPQPDAPTLLRRLPEPGCARRADPDLSGAPAEATSGPRAQAPLRSGAVSADATVAGSGTAPASLGAGTVTTSSPEGSATRAATAAVGAPPRSADRGSVAPLAAGRFRLQVTLGSETRDKLLRAQALMRHAQPDGDLAVVLDRALSCLVDELERRKFGRRKRPGEGEASGGGVEAVSEPSLETVAVPRSAGSATVHDGREARLSPETVPAAVPPSRGERRPDPGRSAGLSPETVTGARARHRASTGDRVGDAAAPPSERIPRAIKRSVAERDGFRCTYVAADGRRCEEIAFLEFHHLQARALGGPTTIENLVLRCRLHNLEDAVRDFGAAKVRGRGRRRDIAAETGRASAAELP